MIPLSKSKILSGQQCDKRLWLEIHRPEARTEDAQVEARLQAGTDVGVIARREWPDGILADEDDFGRAIEMTRTWMDDPDRPLFEGVFIHDQVRIRPDALVPNGSGGIDLYEVKSSTSVKDYHITDVTVQAWLLRELGLKLDRVFLTHIDNQFVYPGNGDYHGLFTHSELTETAAENAQFVPGWIAHYRHMLTGDEPAIAVGPHCNRPFSCPFLEYCDDRVESPVTGDPVTNPDGVAPLRDLNWPRYYLDFETIQFAVPIWPGSRPWQQNPFQWSCHIQHADGTLEHAEFLAAPDGVPFHGFAEALVKVLGEAGPILVYHAPFERGVINETARLVPELAPQLEAISARIVDLLPITRASWNHPAMHGSWSLKSVLPTVAPDLDYAALGEVTEGGAAMTAIAEYIHPDTTPQRREEIADALRKYCGLDTLALVRLAQHLENLT